MILLMNVPFMILIYSFGVLLMLYQKGENPLNRALLKQMLNVPLVSCLVGVVILAAGWSLPTRGRQQFENDLQRHGSLGDANRGHSAQQDTCL